MKLSILTPTIITRWDQAEKLAFKIMGQIEEKECTGDVEHLILHDNCTRTIGAKRQSLVNIARGEYIAFVDDDDDVSDDYVASLLAAIEMESDVITFHQLAIYNGLESEVHFGINNRDEAFKPGGITLRAPWHVCAWKRSAIAPCQFAETNYGEDRIWSLQARQRAKTGYHIPRVLHTYRHDAATTAAPEL